MPNERVVITGTCHDCGGRCVHKAYVREGRIVRLETDDGPEPQHRSCLRGRAYRQRIYAPDRLKQPLVRTGERGEGNFRPASWDEALDKVAGELNRVKGEYGPEAIFYIGASGSHGALHSRVALDRLINQFGGCTPRWGNVSGGGALFASRATYGTYATGHSRDDLLNARLIVMWAWNPAVTIQGTNTTHYLAQARERGTRVVCVDPRFTESAAVFADQWIPLRPGTDTAVMLAMAYVMIEEGLHDQAFLEKYTVGFEPFRQYVTGEEDGIPKTPAWAESISGAPAAAIAELSRDYATIRPAALIPGWAPGRTAYGEQYHRAAAVLAAMTGNIGVSGGNPAGAGMDPRGGHPLGDFRLPAGTNPLEAETPSSEDSFDSRAISKHRVYTSKVWDAILGGRRGGYPSDIKLLYITHSNCLNQWLDINKGRRALAVPEFIVVHDQFPTATVKYADVVLPATTHFERNDLYGSWLLDYVYIYGNKVIEPLHDSKSDFEIASLLAERLGMTDYSNLDEEGWLDKIFEDSEELPAHIDNLQEFKQRGVHKIRLEESMIAFKAQIEDPKNNPFPTPSGKIEIYSQRLAELGDPLVPPIPRYIVAWEGRDDPLAERYPLQLITTHFRRRVHSCFDNVPWLQETQPQALTISRMDAESRGIRNGEQVRVYNARGETFVAAQVTERVMPGVVDLPEGAWYAPDEAGADRAGNPNVLTRDECSPGGAFPSNTCLVQVERADRS